MPMSDRWRPNFKAEFRKEIERFLEENDQIPYSDPREFVESIVKQKIMEIGTREKDIEEAAKNMIKEDLELD